MTFAPQIKEISQQSFALLNAKGYAPFYVDEEKIDFDCQIDGVKFSFYLIDDDVFGYSAEFTLKEELNENEIEHLEHIYMQTDTDDVAFENFHMDGKFICLSSAFAWDFYPEDFTDRSIKALTDTGGIAAELKAKSYVGEEH